MRSHCGKLQMYVAILRSCTLRYAPSDMAHASLGIRRSPCQQFTNPAEDGGSHPARWKAQPECRWLPVQDLDSGTFEVNISSLCHFLPIEQC